MERPPKEYVCEKCGYLGDTSEHEGCDYLAWTTGEQLYIDHLERELALLKASPASAQEGWKHSCNALCMDAVELWIPQCPHCGKPAPTPPENKALLEAVAEVVWYDPQLSQFPEKPGKIIDGSIAFMESAEIGTKLFAAPVPSVSEDRKDAELLDYIQNHGATIQIVPMANRTFGFEVGGLHKSRKLSVREAIDAAMQEDKP